MAVPEEVLDHMADAMIDPHLRKGAESATPSGRPVRRVILQRALDAAAEHGFVLVSLTAARPFETCATVCPTPSECLPAGHCLRNGPEEVEIPFVLVADGSNVTFRELDTMATETGPRSSVPTWSQGAVREWLPSQYRKG